MKWGYYPPVLMYHHIDDAKALIHCDSVSVKTFELQMEFLKKNNYEVITLEKLFKDIYKGINKFRKTVVITFDDGFKDNLEAVGILKKYDFPASLFLIINTISRSGFLDDNDINWLKENSTFNFGSHTLSHFHLPHLSTDEQTKELAESKRILKEKYNIDTNILAYPLGGFTLDTLALAKISGYIGACTTNRGFLETKKVHPYALRRIKMTNRDIGFRLAMKLTGYYDIFREMKKPSLQHPSFI